MPSSGKPRLGVVEANRLLPVLGVVALLAFPAELVALVVLPVTGVAIGRQLVLVDIAGMAGIALGRGMASEQAVLGVAVMAERDVLPEHRCMAGAAQLSVAPLVRVVLAMAGDAFQRRAAEARRILVAVPALDVAVLAQQLELRQVVVELRLLPVLLGVAIAARGAQRAVVLVVRLMASVAGVGELDEAGRRPVTGLALRGAVLAAQQRSAYPGRARTPRHPSSCWRCGRSRISRRGGRGAACRPCDDIPRMSAAYPSICH